MESVQADNVLTDRAAELDRARGRASLVDPFGRAISYLRVSVTVFTLEELDRLYSAFIARGVRKLRLTGGEPLVRRRIMTVFSSLSRYLRSGRLDELTLTTNSSQPGKYAQEFRAHGVHRRHRRKAPLVDAQGECCLNSL
jgi:cyclic pyranopterin phosphate synthase